MIQIFFLLWHISYAKIYVCADVACQTKIMSDVFQEESIRPQRLDEFIGQDELRANLAVYLQSAKDRGRALDHTLLYGSPGLGKTSLAQIMATELRVNLVTTSEPVLEKTTDRKSVV